MTPRPKSRAFRTRTRTQLHAEVFAKLRDYARRERAGEDVGDPEMIALWHRLCELVGVRP